MTQQRHTFVISKLLPETGSFGGCSHVDSSNMLCLNMQSKAASLPPGKTCLCQSPGPLTESGVTLAFTPRRPGYGWAMILSLVGTRVGSQPWPLVRAGRSVLRRRTEEQARSATKALTNSFWAVALLRTISLCHTPEFAPAGACVHIGWCFGWAASQLQVCGACLAYEAFPGGTVP